MREGKTRSNLKEPNPNIPVPPAPPPARPMKTLEQHNQEIRDKAFAPYPRPNGIECPLCKAELFDMNSSELYSYPPQKEVMCSRCVWTGTRLC